jgi:hypothetical protein
MVRIMGMVMVRIMMGIVSWPIGIPITMSPIMAYAPSY